MCATPAVANALVYFAVQDSYLYAVSASTGVLLWSYFPAGYYSSPAVANGLVYVGAANGQVYADTLSDAQLGGFEA